MNQTLNDRLRALEYCQGLLRSHDLSAYMHCHFLPAQLQPHFHAIHALKIELFKAGELARHSTLRASRMAWWLDNIEKARLNQPNPEPVSIALDYMQRRVSVRKSHMERMVRGRLEDVSLKTWAQFDRFVDDNYALPFYLLLEVMGLYGEAEFTAATFVGRAVGIADILSRTRLYVETGRCLFPEEILLKVLATQHHISPGSFQEQEGVQTLPESFYDAVLEVAAYGKRYLQDAREVKGLPGASFVALLPAVQAEMYYERLEKWNFAVMNGRTHKVNALKSFVGLLKGYRGRRF